MSSVERWSDRRRRVAAFGETRATPSPRLRSLAAGLLHLARRAFSEPLMLSVERHEILLRRLPRELDGLRVVQLSDIHNGPFTAPGSIERAVEVANGLDPDIVALTGDYVSHEREFAAPCAEILGRLRARCGVYAILGNHDHWTDAALITDLFRAEGITVLVNEGMRFEHPERPGAAFWLAGVDDTMVGLEDLPLALAGSRADELKLLLAHNPVVLRRAARAGVDLVLSGHTHGGQVTWRSESSASGRPRRRLLRGLGRQGATQIYVSRGLGTVVLPVRYGCLPEVSLLELKSGDG
ncbi:MAG: metallophosphoesterase [Acidobacteria bacterium]|nr:metallophosphoesterase [Acidobacteriota bacterium]MCA1642777.1 metallophosphoesterase [Acidobacteriota bacterium]